MLVLVANHLISKHEAFEQAVAKATKLAGDGFLVTFGISPTAPEIGYGYIETDGCMVKRFVEKPTMEKAQSYLASGIHLWNAEMFCFRAGALLSEMHTHAPDVLAAASASLAASDQANKRNAIQIELNADSFRQVPDISIDYALMERTLGIAVVPFSGAWSDVGSWTAVADMGDDMGEGNRAGGQTTNAHFLGANNTYVHASARPVVALGTRDLLIVDTPDALLVADRGHAEAVKAVVAKLEALDAQEAIHHRRVARPWGWYDTIDAGDRFQVKRITVKPGASLSLQLHHHRAEHWIVVQGTARVTRGDETFLLVENQSTYIPLGERHRLHNPGKTALEMIEVQSGGYLGEDDIVRFDDSYGRA